MDTDASDVGICAVLTQIQKGRERVLAYSSRALYKTKQSYCTTRWKLLVMVEFTSHFQQYLLGWSSVFCTDHSSLRWLKRMKDPEGQFARWLERFASTTSRSSTIRVGCTVTRTAYPGGLATNPVYVSCQIPLPILQPSVIRPYSVSWTLMSTRWCRVQWGWLVVRGAASGPGC